MRESGVALLRARRLGRALLWLGLVGLALLHALPGAAAPPADAVPAQTADAGETLYAQHCASCHGPDGGGTFRGPSLVGVGAAGADFYLRSGRMPIDHPQQEAKRRPAAFDEAEIRALVDLVDGFGDGPPVPDVDVAAGDVARGGALFRLDCAACHNWDARGGALLHHENAPPLHGVPPRQAAEAIRIGPGSMPAFDADALPDEDLEDVLAYLRLLQSPPDRGGFGLGHWGPATEMVAALAALGAVLLFTGWLGERR